MHLLARVFYYLNCIISEQESTLHCFTFPCTAKVERRTYVRSGTVFTSKITFVPVAAGAIWARISLCRTTRLTRPESDLSASVRLSWSRDAFACGKRALHSGPPECSRGDAGSSITADISRFLDQCPPWLCEKHVAIFTCSGELDSRWGFLLTSSLGMRYSRSEWIHQGTTNLDLSSRKLDGFLEILNQCKIQLMRKLSLTATSSTQANLVNELFCSLSTVWFHSQDSGAVI